MKYDWITICGIVLSTAMYGGCSSANDSAEGKASYAPNGYDAGFDLMENVADAAAMAQSADSEEMWDSGLDDSPFDQLITEGDAEVAGGAVPLFASESQVHPGFSEDIHQACLPEPSLAEKSCDDRECEVLRSCCVSDGNCCQAMNVEGIPEQLDFNDCSEEDAEQCFTALGYPTDAFGPAPSSIHHSAFYPGGDERGESGLRFEENLDLTYQRVEVSALFHSSQTCGTSCIEGVGIGLFSGDEFTAHSNHDVALVYSSTLQQVRLLVGGTVVGQVSLSDTQQKWTLLLQPTGQVQAFRDDGEDEPVFQTSFEPKSGSKLILFGHNPDPSSEAGAHLSDLSIDLARCDIPNRWQQRTAITLLEPDNQPWQPDLVASPSVAYDNEGTASMVFSSEGAIYFAQSKGDDPNTFTLMDYANTPALSRLDFEEDTTALGDPFILYNGNDWTLYYTVKGEKMGTYIAFADTADGKTFSSSTRIELDDIDGIVDSPTVIQHESGRWVMIVHEQSETQKLIIFESVDRSRWVRLYDSTLEDMTKRPLEPDANTFDRDAITSPHLSIHNGAWHLYYSGHRGTRLNIGLLVSDNLTRWRRVIESDPVFTPTSSGFERHSVFDPRVVERKDSVELFYVASDGYRNQIGRAIRSATSSGAVMGNDS